MSNVVAFLLGVGVMSLFTIAAVTFAESGKDVPAIICMGPVFWVYLAIGYPATWAVKKVRLWWFRRNFVKAKVFHDEQFHGDMVYVHKNVVDLFYTKEDNHPAAYVVFEGDCSNAKSTPYKLESCISAKGLLYKGDRNSWKADWIAGCVRPYSDLYFKISHGG